MKKKKILTLAVAAALMSGCGKDAGLTQDGSVSVSFNVSGDFGNPTFTRATLSADGVEMTDLWVFDYVDGTLAQQLHQSPSDADWGEPSLSLAMGTHHIYFVASRGGSPVVDTDGGTITWGKISDTFWKDYTLTVSETTGKSRTVTLDRVVTRLRIKVKDEVPASAASLVVFPAKWYSGINYTTGESCGERTQEMSVAIPSSYAGTSGQLSVSFFSLSPQDEWRTDFTVSARDAENDIIGTADISGAPFIANRATVYSGNLFGQPNGIGVSLSDTWMADYEDAW